jgi:hypothetical protein
VLDGSASDLQLQNAQLGRKYKGSASRWYLEIYFYCGIIVTAKHLYLVSLRISFTSPSPALHIWKKLPPVTFPSKKFSAKYMANGILPSYFCYRNYYYMHAVIYITKTSLSIKGLLYIMALLTDVMQRA